MEEKILTRIIDRLNEILENASSLEYDDVYSEMKELEREMEEIACELEADEGPGVKKKWKLYDEIMNQKDRIAEEFSFYDPAAEMQMLFPNGSDDPDDDEYYGLGEFADRRN